MPRDYRSKKRYEKFDADSSIRFQEKSALSTKPESGVYNSTVPGDYKQIITPIIVKADPYDKGTVVGDPYSITNKPNKVIDVSYPGRENTAGNILVQLRSRVDSGNKLMKRFDTAKHHLSLNYLYLAMQASESNVNNNYQMEESFEEALSLLSAEVLTQITGLNYVYNPEAGATTFPHSASGNALFGGAILYQTILQNLNSVIIGYNKLIANEKAILDMSFNTTTTQVLELYNLLKKATFAGKLKAVSDMILGEYFDLNWAKQMNILQVGLSHKSQSFTDPSLELFGTHRLPVVDIGITPAGGSYTSIIKTTDFKVGSGADAKTLPQLVREFLDKTSTTSVLEWARQVVYGGDQSETSAKVYFNTIEGIVDDIRKSLSSFKAKFSGIRTVFDVLAKTNMMYWSKAVSAQVISKPGTVVDPVKNRLVEDIYRSLVGLKNIDLDSTSYKFRYYTVWDKYDGISRFDIFSGGSFIPFSSKTVTGLPVDATYKNSVKLIPVLYIPDETVKAVNRLGEEVTISIVDLPDALSDTVTWPLRKLNPLEVNMPIKLACVVLPTASFDAQMASHLQDFIMDVFGIGYFEKKPASGASTYQFIVKPTYLAYIDIEVVSQSEAMLDFCRTYSPFRLQSPNEARTIGFQLGGFKNDKVSKDN